MSIQSNSLEQLQSELREIEDLLKYAKCFGSVAIGRIKITKEELENKRTTLKSEIASIQSQTKLRIVK